METLLLDLQKMVFGLIPAHQFALRCTCKAWRDLQESPAIISPRTVLEALEAGGDPAWLKEVVAGGWGGDQANEFLFHASAKGSVEGVSLAKAWGATDFDQALCRAAENGQLVTMELLIGECSTDRLDDAFYSAAEGGHLDAMELLRKWGADYFNDTFGGTGGQPPARGWDATYLNNALACATTKGQLEAMIVLRTWGATDFHTALGYAAEKGHLEAMTLLRTWYAAISDVAPKRGLLAISCDIALHKAAGEGQLEAMKLLVPSDPDETGWGATDLNGPLVSAARSGQLEAMGLLHRLNGAWDATVLNCALESAARSGQLRAMELLVHGTGWGAAALGRARAGAVKGDQRGALELLEAWGAADT